MRIETKTSHLSQGGFTLIEVTVAISILAVMALLNYNIIRSLVEAKVEIDDTRQGTFVANSVLTRLTRELQLAGKEPKLPPSCEDPDAPKQSIVLIGEGGGQSSGGQNPSITFSAREGGQYIPDGGTHSGAVQITYRVEKDPDQKSGSDSGLLLIRDEIPNRPPYAQSCKDAIRFPITNRLVNIEFKYFDKKTREWSDTWVGQKSANLPDIIQFTLRLKSERGKVESYTSAIKLNP